MNKQNKIRRISTRITAMMMSAIYLTVSTTVPVLAESTYDATIQRDTYSDDVVVNNQLGVSVVTENPDSEAHFEKDLTVNGTNAGGAVGIFAGASLPVINNDKAEATVGGDLNVSAASDLDVLGIATHVYGDVPSAATGVNGNVQIGGNATITHTGSGAGNTKGVEVSALDEKNTSNVTIGGNLSVTSEGVLSATGIEACTGASGTANVTVGNPDNNTGNVNVRNTGEANGIHIAPQSSPDTMGNSNITVKGDVNAQSTSNTGSAKGVYVSTTKPGAKTKVDVGGHVEATANSGSSAYGLYINSEENSITNIDIGKGISAFAATANGVDLTANDTANTNITIGKDSSGNAITVNSNGTGNSASNSNGISVFTGSSNININVEGNIVVDSNAVGASGITVKDGDGGNLKIQVKGDVTSNGAGINVRNMSNVRSADIIIDGTVKSTANGIPAVIFDSNNVSSENVNITAWKIESNNGTALLGKNDGAQILTNNNAQDYVAECISYIIRVTQPEINNTTADVLSLANADGTAWNKKKETLDVAGEGERVYVKLDVPDGCRLAGVYADSARTLALTQDENGSYYLTVPRGGGIDVNVVLELISTAPDPTPTPDPTPAPTPEPTPTPGPTPVPESPSNDYSTAAANDWAAAMARVGSGLKLGKNSGSIPRLRMNNKDDVNNFINLIKNFSTGGTVRIEIIGDRIDAGIVQAMIGRRDLTYEFYIRVDDGSLIKYVIPWGTVLFGLINEDGSISTNNLMQFRIQ